MAKKKNKKNKSVQKKDGKSLLSGGQIERNIMGAVFDPSLDDIESLESRIKNGVNKDLSEIKVMFISEASYLHTGFATYAGQILKRLDALPNMTVAELGSYGHGPDSDPRAKDVSWRFYSNMPINPEEEKVYKANYSKNQFGLFKFAEAMSDFQPDVIMLHRDWWMDEFVINHPLAKRCHIIWMACVDSYPQKWEWMRDFSKADTLMTYSHFGKKVLEDQSVSPLGVRHGIPPLENVMVAQAGVNPEEFTPLDKAATKAEFGLNPDIKIIGTVMRNQPRKLFSRIIDSYADFLVRYPETGKATALLLHTGIPDVGFDIPESIYRNGVEHRVLFSYICHACDANGVDTWGFENRPCKSCGNVECLKTPNTNKGLSTEKFNKIYNIMDLYVQGSIAGADEMPATEAKAAGVPVTCTDYAAMYEKNRNGGAIPIKIATMYTEAETMQNRAMFSIESLADNMNKVLSSDFIGQRMSSEGRATAVESYDWDLTGKKWIAAIMDADLKGRDMWDVQTISALINTDGASQEDIDLTRDSILPFVDEVIETGTEPLSKWTISLNAGEVAVCENKQALRSEAEKSAHSNCRLEVIVLKETDNGLDFDIPLVETRLYENMEGVDQNNKMVLCSRQENAQAYMDHKHILAQDELNKEHMKNTYWRIGQAVGLDTIGTFYIIRRVQR